MTIKSRLLSTPILLFTLTSTAYATVDRSHVSFTNNTAKTMHLNGSFNSTDDHFKRGEDWQINELTLAPYETKEVLWFSRYAHVKSNQLYQYTVSATPDNEHLSISFSIDEKGDLLRGSTLSQALTTPEQQQVILKNTGLEHYQTDIGQHHYAIHTRKWYPLDHVYSDFQIVIDEEITTPVVSNQASNLTVLTYNTQLMPFYTGIENILNQPAIRAETIPNQISQYDVVILEELFDKDLRHSITKGMSAFYPYHTRVVGEGTNRVLTGGVMIFSKWPIEKDDQIIYAANDGIDALAAKGAGYAVINKNGQRYHVFGTHPIAGNSEHIREIRHQELQELNHFIETQAIPSNEPVLMAGDFNVNEYDDEINTLVSTLNAVSPPQIGYHYSCDPTVNTMNNGKDRSRLDYVLYRADHQHPTSAYNQVYILRALQDERKWPRFDLSDHFPVGSLFTFK